MKIVFHLYRSLSFIFFWYQLLQMCPSTFIAKEIIKAEAGMFKVFPAYFGISHVWRCWEAQNRSLCNAWCKLESCLSLLVLSSGHPWAAARFVLLIFPSFLFRSFIHQLVRTCTPYPNISLLPGRLRKRWPFCSGDTKSALPAEKPAAHTDLEPLASSLGSRSFLSYWSQKSRNDLFSWPGHFCFFLNLFIICLFVLLLKALKKWEENH